MWTSSPTQKFFVNGPYTQDGFAFCHLLGGSEPHFLACNDTTTKLLPSNGIAVKECVPFDTLGITGAYRQIEYSICQGKDRVIYTGKFAFIPKNHPDVSFGFLSCNDNPACADIPGNTYFDGFATGLFERLRAEAHDVVVHMGDNVYLDSVWAQFRTGTVNETDAKALARQYYIRSFADAEQGACMRQGAQMQMIDDHDFMDGYGTVGYQEPQDAEKLAVYERLVRAVHEEFMQTPASPSTDIGAYRVVLMNTRDAMRRTGQRFPPELNVALAGYLAAPLPDRKFIVCLPQPLVHLDPYHAYLHGLFFSEGVDESEHPISRDGAHICTRMLMHRSSTHKVFVVSGDVHWGYIQDHEDSVINGTFAELVTSGITRKPRSKELWIFRAVLWCQRTFHFRRCTTGARNRRAMVQDHSFGSLRNDRFSITSAGA
jgi:hypothetical protein